MIGQIISHYRIVEKLGGGGMGVVYKAEDTRLHRFVALKFLPEEVARNPQFVARFVREAHAASALNHPHICTIYDVGHTDDRYFIAMELMEGRTLKDVIADGLLSIEQVLEWGHQIADGLDDSHSKGIIHRDLKPGNLFITSREQAKILDFGLAKIVETRACETGSPQVTFLSDITAPGSVFGTIEYMSPEQVRGEPVDTRTDLFSLGIVLYEMTTGERPFVGATAGAIFDSILHNTPALPTRLNPATPPKLEEIINKALEKDRNLRYQHAADMRTDLQRLKRDHASEGLCVTPAPPADRVLQAAAPKESVVGRSIEVVRGGLFPMIGQVLSHYTILEQIGAGGMGVVYRAHDEHLDRDVAIKVLAPGTLIDEVSRKRFRKEALALAKLNHFNIATIHEFGTQSGTDFLVTEYIKGVTLDAKLASGALAEEEVVSFGSQLAAGLAAAHDQGIIHRDLKPGNLRVTGDGLLKILDFGLARLVEPETQLPPTATGTLTRSQEVTGTLPYMAPEQLRGLKTDERTDIWAAGAVLYEMATGCRPFPQEQTTDLMVAILQQPPAQPRQLNPHISPGLESIILKALNKESAHRHQSARELQADVQRLGSRTSAAPVHSPSQPSPFSAPQLEMAHVLFMDIVAYSTLPMDAQREQLHELQELVSGTSEFAKTLARDKLIRLPTGDGMALVFFGDPVAPVGCALEISKALRQHEEIRLRMGIHTGPVYRVQDINAARNVAGSGINMAQRVMDCGDAGHILLSKAVADVLSEVSGWRNLLSDLGEAEIKHGMRVHLYNLVTGDAGNPELPQKLRPAVVRRAAEAATQKRPKPRANRLALSLTAGLAVAVLIAFSFRAWINRGLEKPVSSPAAIQPQPLVSRPAQQSGSSPKTSLAPSAKLGPPAKSGDLVSGTSGVVLSPRDSTRPKPELNVPALREPATLLIRSTPGGPHVYVDDKAVVGTANSEGQVRISPLPPGRHHLRLTLEGYGDYDDDVDLVAGQALEVGINLKSAGSAARTAPISPSSLDLQHFQVRYFHAGNFGATEGTITVGAGVIRFEPHKPKDSKHRLEFRLREVNEVTENYGGFGCRFWCIHIGLNNGKNYNFGLPNQGRGTAKENVQAAVDAINRAIGQRTSKQ